ncbi:hypothetical protein [Nonomuraea roseoviolacea]|uniref:hypothetical protein n=1 Tax=Nonomuraea roseoviolacea TaxID=103837 RepID=UPI0031E1500E
MGPADRLLDGVPLGVGRLDAQAHRSSFPSGSLNLGMVIMTGPAPVSSATVSGERTGVPGTRGSAAQTPFQAGVQAAFLHRPSPE